MFNSLLGRGYVETIDYFPLVHALAWLVQLQFFVPNCCTSFCSYCNALALVVRSASCLHVPYERLFWFWWKCHREQVGFYPWQLLLALQPGRWLCTRLPGLQQELWWAAASSLRIGPWHPLPLTLSFKEINELIGCHGWEVIWPFPVREWLSVRMAVLESPLCSPVVNVQL